MATVAGSMRFFSRRAFARLLAGASLAPLRCAAEPERPESLQWSQERPPLEVWKRRYRVDAQVLVFGMTLFRRQDVGGGSTRWCEFGGDGAERLLEFHGFSLPQRAAGLNRLGFIREMARGASGGECIYFGLMTASPEESAGEARRALRSDPTEQAYTAIDGRIGGGGSETAIAHFTGPAAISGESPAQLVARARRALASAGTVAAPAPRPEYRHSFLQALAGLLLRPGCDECRFLYGGRAYRLRLTRSRDGEADAYFRGRKLIGPSEQVVRVAGRVQTEAGGRQTDFRLWVTNGKGRPLPLRIEYQPRSYLRLTFEAVT
jgi:hypothetical protein